MNRRGFLRLLGGAVVAAAAPTKAYSFLGGILRPRGLILTPKSEIEYRDYFQWNFSLTKEIFRITDLKIETNERGAVISWTPTEKTRYIFQPLGRINGEA